ncbi:MAG: CopD family protein [Aeromicrobium sp.]
MTLDIRRPGTRRPTAPLSSRRSSWLVVALVAMVVAAWLASSLPQPPPIGIPDPGVVTRWGLPVATVVRDLGASFAIGLLVIGLLMRSELSPATRLAMSRAIRGGALSTVVAVAALYLLTASDVYSVPLGSVIGPDRLGALYRETDIGRRLAQQIALWMLVTGAVLVPRPAGRAAALALAVGAMVPWAFGGHAAGSGDHRLAVYSVLLHLIGVTVWCGGVAALVWVSRLEPARTVAVMSRFSPVALVAFGVVGASGLLASWIRLPEVSALWGSGYGRLILVKAALLVVLGGFGAWHRRTALRRMAGPRGATTAAVVRAVAAEGLVMAAAMGVAVALSRTPLS